VKNLSFVVLFTVLSAVSAIMLSVVMLIVVAPKTQSKLLVGGLAQKISPTMATLSKIK
jgi:hypothetical protein